jgi:hypothetical protein
LVIGTILESVHAYITFPNYKAQLKDQFTLQRFDWSSTMCHAGDSSQVLEVVPNQMGTHVRT